MKCKSLIAVLTVCIISVVVISGTNEVTAYYSSSSDLRIGPYVDNVDFEVISVEEQRILALQAGTIEMDSNTFDSVYYDQLKADPDIDIYSGLKNGYGHITINCRDYPLNISALRRAFAYSFNKTQIVTDLFDGFAQEHDSIVPYPNPWCIEDDFTYHYYFAQPDIGNAILDAAGFDIDGVTGFRDAPDGSPFDINVEYPSSSPDLGAGVAQVAVDALTALHIDAYSTAADFFEYITRLDTHGEYDMVFYTANYYGTDVDWLAYEYWSGYADVNYMNPCNFANSTYDSYREDLLYSTTYEEVYAAATAMQEILQDNVPRLVVYENMYIQAYRTDEFTGHIEDLENLIAGPWTMRNIHKSDDTLGGTVPVAISQQPNSLNLFVSNNAASASILSNLYSSLYKYGPDLEPIPDLAESLFVETHEDNLTVPVGHMRYTIDIIQNATWNDGMPLTSQDIEFTLTYMLESYSYGNPAGIDLAELTDITSPSPYQIILEFSTESYWHFSDFVFEYILPYHKYSTTPYSSWNSAFYPYVTSGPFSFDSYETGEWYRISKNLYYYNLPPNPAPVVSNAEDLTYVEGTTGNMIVWEVSDDNPLLYSIYKDDNLTAIVIDFWDGSDISLNVDGLAVGVYNYTLIVFDYSANFVFSSIVVTVIPATTTTTYSREGLPIDTMTILMAIGAIGIIVVVIVIWKSKQS